MVMLTKTLATPRASLQAVLSLAVVAFAMSGCVAGGNITHEDSPAAQKRDEGPALCRDGTVPPCNTRS
jgi:hypothetical protein